MKETWKKIRNWEGYEVSNLGGVKSCERVIFVKGGKARRLAEKVLKAAKSGSAKNKAEGKYFETVELCSEGLTKKLYVHRLVTEAFLGEAEGRRVKHKNGIFHDNRVENLEYQVSQKAEFKKAMEYLMGNVWIEEEISKNNGLTFNKTRTIT